MEVHGFWQVVGGGCLGGLLVELLRIAERLVSKRPPQRLLRDIIASVLKIAVGGIFAGLSASEVHTLFVAAQLGATAPAIIGAWVSGGKAEKPGGRPPAPETAPELPLAPPSPGLAGPMAFTMPTPAQVAAPRYDISTSDWLDSLRW